MLLEDFNKQIDYWNDWLANQKEEERKYDLSFFKIWIIFERFLVDIVISYSCGLPSERGFIPKQKLKFLDESHFNYFFKKNTYVDYISVIENYSEQIFVDNPFQIITILTPYHDYYLKMKVIRNYIAHESFESRVRYLSVFFGSDESKLLDPNEYLSKFNKRSGLTNYFVFVNAIKEMAEYICYPYF